MSELLRRFVLKERGVYLSSTWAISWPYRWVSRSFCITYGSVRVKRNVINVDTNFDTKNSTQKFRHKFFAHPSELEHRSSMKVLYFNCYASIPTVIVIVFILEVIPKFCMSIVVKYHILNKQIDQLYISQQKFLFRNTFRSSISKCNWENEYYRYANNEF